MNGDTEIQLDLLRELCRALSAKAVPWWLFGGWAVDWYVGEVTRDHADIELFIHIEDAAAVREALVNAGFVAPPGLYPAECQTFVKHGQEVGAWFLTQNESGGWCTPGRWADWTWAPGSFAGGRMTFLGIDALVMSPEGLLDIKENFHAHPHGAPLRDKDVVDIEHLQRAILGRATRRSAT